MSKKIVRISNLNGIVKYKLPEGQLADQQKLEHEVSKYDGKLYRLISIEGFQVVLRTLVAPFDAGWEQFHRMLHELSDTKELYRVSMPANAL